MATPRDELLSAAQDEGPAAIFLTLRAAAARAAEAVTEAVTAAAAGDSADDSGLATLAELSPALADLSRLADAVPGLIRASFPGDQVESMLTARTATLKEASADVAAQLSALAELQSAEAELATIVADHQDLRDQVARLRRLERLAGALTELATQQKLIDARVAVLKESVTAPEHNLAAGCADLIRLTAERLALLKPSTRDLIDKAGAEQARLAALETEAIAQQAALAQAAQRLAELRELHDSRAAALRQHVKADREILMALTPLVKENGTAPDSGLDAARQALTGIEAALILVDSQLAAVLRSQELTPVTGP